MPDITICNSTVCSVRRDCMRNWDSRQYVPDRDPKVQKWVPLEVLHGVGHDKRARPEDCSWYKPVLAFPKTVFEDQPYDM